MRVGLLSLRNLLASGDAIMASDMVDAGLAKAVASRAMQVGRAETSGGKGCTWGLGSYMYLDGTQGDHCCATAVPLRCFANHILCLSLPVCACVCLCCTVVG